MVSSQYVAEPRSGVRRRPARREADAPSGWWSPRWWAAARRREFSRRVAMRQPRRRSGRAAGRGGRHRAGDLHRESDDHGGSAMRRLAAHLALAALAVPGGIRTVLAVPSGWQRRTSRGRGAPDGGGRAGGDGDRAVPHKEYVVRPCAALVAGGEGNWICAGWARRNAGGTRVPTGNRRSAWFSRRMQSALTAPRSTPRASR